MAVLIGTAAVVLRNKMTSIVSGGHGAVDDAAKE
jgi:hypothetical protein